jgi:hypothetical protein
MIRDRNRIQGIAQPLPEGESLLWEGAPDRAALARHALHIRLAAGYFAVIILFGLIGAMRDQLALQQVAVTLGIQLLLSALVIGAVQLYAVITARTTIYAVTDRRVVMRVGVVLPTTINIPFHLINAAAARDFADGTGQISLTIRPPDRLGFVHLWPHVRPWRLRWPEPMLRGLTDPAGLARIIREAAATSGPVITTAQAAPTPAIQPAPALRVNGSLSTAHKTATT